MILKNSKGKERNFKILLKIEYHKQIYIVYEDYITSKCYVGIKDDNKLKKLDSESFSFISKLLEGVE